MTLIRSFGGAYQTSFFFTTNILIYEMTDDHDDHGIQTRIVSRVLLRVGQSTLLKKLFFNLAHYYQCSAHWRQTYFRPNKPLPTNVGSNQSRLPIAPRKPFKWAIVDFFVSCLFLGIPYIFFERTRLSTRIVDEESGLRYATPTLVIGACTCLVVRPYSISPLLASKPTLS